MLDDKCCGTCKYHHYDDIDDGWVCVNDRSECCTDWIGYEDSCNEWEGREYRSMSDMELSRELCKIAGVCSECLVQDMCDKGHTGFEQWLKEEVKEDE